MNDDRRFFGWLQQQIKSLFHGMEGLIRPNHDRCLICGGVCLSSNEPLPLCKGCLSSIPWILEVQCPRCGRYVQCPDCMRPQETFFVQNRSCVQYDDRMKEWLALYKYRGRETLKEVLGGMLMHAYHLHKRSGLTGGEEGYEAITYVPLSEERYLERGFNQAEQLATELGRRTGAQVIPLLRRTRHTDKQSFKGRSARVKDMHGIFELDDRGADLLLQKGIGKNGRLYLVDDVYTTGSTLNECARVIRKDLQVEVFGITFAR